MRCAWRVRATFSLSHFQTPLMLLEWLSLFCLFVVGTKSTTRPTVGVIRWDAWNQVNGIYDNISWYVHRDMNPEQFHYRLPYYVDISNPENITFNNDNQTIMEQEIEFAHKAGIDYFVFDTYCSYDINCATFCIFAILIFVCLIFLCFLHFLPSQSYYF